MPKQYVFCATAGRTGTAFLSSLLKANIEDCESHHEILGYNTFGVDTPDISHFHAFNAFGNNGHVQEFWQHKLDKIKQTPNKFYVETSHLLMKAGLFENLELLADNAQVHIVILKRDWKETIISYRNRFDFFNKGNMWMWYLDNDYPKNMVNSSALKSYGMYGFALWYLCEIAVRTEYYKMAFADKPWVKFHEIDILDLNRQDKCKEFIQDITGDNVGFVTIPEPLNQNSVKQSGPDPDAEKISQLLDKTSIDIEAIAAECYGKFPWF